MIYARNLKRVARLRQIITVFFEEGFGLFIKKAHLHHYVPFSKKLQQQLLKKEKEIKPEIRLRRALERLGPTFVKLGQALSLRPDLLPPKYIAELEKMQDRVPPFSFSEVREIIKQELGNDINKLFTKFDPKPIASASLAQVHKAKLKTGQIVAVKVQRPDSEEKIKQDIEILLWLAHWLQKHVAFFQERHIVEIIEEFKRWTYRELNFRYEALNAKVLRNNLKGSREVVIPKIYDNYTTEKVLTLEFLDAYPLHDIATIRKKKNFRRIMRIGYTAILQMIFKHGFFHADPHPGNILVLKKGNRIAFVDFGIVGKFNDKLRKQTTKLFRAVLKNDSDAITDAFLSMRIAAQDKVDVEKLRQDLWDIFEPLRFESLKNIKISNILNRGLETTSRHNLRMPLDFVLFAKTLFTLEGIGLRYSPDFKLLAESRPVIQKLVREQYKPRRIAKDLATQLAKYQKLFEKTPEYLSEALERISAGKLKIELVPKEFSALRVEVEHGSGNIAIGLMTAALIISSALVLLVIEEPKILGIPTLSFFGFITAFALGLWLVKRTVFLKQPRTT